MSLGDNSQQTLGEFKEIEDDYSSNASENVPWYLSGPRTVLIESYDISDDDLSTDSESPLMCSTEKMCIDNEMDSVASEEMTVSAEYWQIRKLMKYLKAGDESSTLVALVFLAKYNFSNPIIQAGIRDTGGLEILINLINVENQNCKKGTLRVLRNISIAPSISKYLIELGIFDEMIELFRFPEEDLMLLSCAIYRSLSVYKKTRTILRKNGTLPFLVQTLSIIPIEVFTMEVIRVHRRDKKRFRIALDCLVTLTNLAKSLAVRRELYHLGIIQTLPALLTAADERVKLSALKLTMMCASLPMFRKSFEAIDILSKVMASSQDPFKEEITLRTIHKMCLGKAGRKRVMSFGMVNKLVSLIKDEKTLIADKEIVFKFAVGTLYRLGIEKSVRDGLLDKNLIPRLIDLIEHYLDKVSRNVAGILSYLSAYPENWEVIRSCGGISRLIRIISTRRDPKYVAHVAKIIGDVAHNEKAVVELAEHDALVHLWSLLHNSSSKVKIAASRAVVPLLMKYPDAAEVVRSLEGSLELLIQCLSSPVVAVRAGACQALTEVLKDKENYAIISQLGLVEKVSSMAQTVTDSDLLKESFGVLISGLAGDPQNQFELGKRGVIKYLVEHLHSVNENVRVSAAHALWKLSVNPINCVNIHNSGTVRLLLECIQSANNSLIEAAGGCLYNMRNVAHDAEQFKLFGHIPQGVENPQYKEYSQPYVPSFFFDSDIEE